MNNGRFSISMHILTLLDLLSDELLTSEVIAGSININPVLVRKEISNLKKHGLVESKEGKTGGYALAKPARQILLSDVYTAVRQVPLLGSTRNSPNPACVVGKQINKHLDTLYTEAEDALLKKLGKSTLADFSKKFS
ncbi:RrF2 family transcriptional regulator [Chryseolinea lacunae]|uniref:Rrf2 family transcriptional regulator n=1 Tax=Chryseolinea lacunae TaxID=2801331 RepID=A0ABS1KW49_9BACT|nr:Rrf2 family transcriptional regulator [Chryseolinea lacunae]MBL0743570.1 Rrf2 family transcriptional regulator [Chryseolinea lacunae]